MIQQTQTIERGWEPGPMEFDDGPMVRHFIAIIRPEHPGLYTRARCGKRRFLSMYPPVKSKNPPAGACRICGRLWNKPIKK